MNTVHTLDVRQHINGRKMSGYQWLLLFLCFLIVTTDGMDVAIMGFLAPAITKEWGISKAAFGVVMSAAPIGLAFGALLIGPLSDRYGRKRLLMLAVAWFGTFSILSRRPAMSTSSRSCASSPAWAWARRCRTRRRCCPNMCRNSRVAASSPSCSPASISARPWSASAPP
jgi:MFS family permease